MAEKKPKKIWDNCEYIGEVHRSERTKIKFELVARDGVKYINMRDWYLRKRDMEWMPGLSGFAIPIAFPINGSVELPSSEVIEVLQECIDKAAGFALEGNEVWSPPKEVESNV